METKDNKQQIIITQWLKENCPKLLSLEEKFKHDSSANSTNDNNLDNKHHSSIPKMIHGYSSSGPTIGTIGSTRHQQHIMKMMNHHHGLTTTMTTSSGVSNRISSAPPSPALSHSSPIIDNLMILMNDETKSSSSLPVGSSSSSSSSTSTTTITTLASHAHHAQHHLQHHHLHEQHHHAHHQFLQQQQMINNGGLRTGNETGTASLVVPSDLYKDDWTPAARNALIYVGIILSIYLVAVATIAIQYYRKHHTLDPFSAYLFGRTSGHSTQHQRKQNYHQTKTSTSTFSKNIRHKKLLEKQEDKQKPQPTTTNGLVNHLQISRLPPLPPQPCPEQRLQTSLNNNTAMNMSQPIDSSSYTSASLITVNHTTSETLPGNLVDNAITSMVNSYSMDSGEGRGGGGGGTERSNVGGSSNNEQPSKQLIINIRTKQHEEMEPNELERSYLDRQPTSSSSSLPTSQPPSRPINKTSSFSTYVSVNGQYHHQQTGDNSQNFNGTTTQSNNNEFLNNNLISASVNNNNKNSQTKIENDDHNDGSSISARQQQTAIVTVHKYNDNNNNDIIDEPNDNIIERRQRQQQSIFMSNEKETTILIMDNNNKENIKGQNSRCFSNNTDDGNLEHSFWIDLSLDNCKTLTDGADNIDSIHELEDEEEEEEIDDEDENEEDHEVDDEYEIDDEDDDEEPSIVAPPANRMTTNQRLRKFFSFGGSSSPPPQKKEQTSVPSRGRFLIRSLSLRTTDKTASTTELSSPNESSNNSGCSTPGRDNMINTTTKMVRFQSLHRSSSIATNTSGGSVTNSGGVGAQSISSGQWLITSNERLNGTSNFGSASTTQQMPANITNRHYEETHL